MLPSRIISVLVALLVALCLLAGPASVAWAKGSFGSPRSFGGGYNRIGRSGWYSQNYRYRTNGMYWYYGSRYYRGGRVPAGYDGPENRLGTGVYSNDQARDVLCKRNVSFDPSTIATPFIDFNTTMTCFKQLYSFAGDPGNVYVEDLMLDRYSWRVSVDGYPTFALIVYPDKDIVDADMNMTMRLRRLVFLKSLPTTDAAAASGFAGGDELDLATLHWAPCTLESCSETASDSFGRPSSRFVDNNRVHTSAVTAIYNNSLRITVRVWLSEDFNEDPFFDHIFLHPAQMKIDVSLEAVNGGGALAGTYVGLEAMLATAAADGGSKVVPIKVDDAQSPIAYDPATMNRVQFGEFNDIADRRAGQLAWFSSSNRRKLCYNETSDAACVRFLDWSGLNTTCALGSASNPSACDNFLIDGQIGRSAHFILQTKVDASYSARLQTHFGFMNPNAVFVAPSAAPHRGMGAVAAVVTVFLLLLTIVDFF